MVAFAIPWAAMGIGALMGGLSSKQRGGNFLKGALQGAALGGITGGIGGLASGTAAGTSAGGVFGFGSKMIPNFLAMSGIGMGAEMLGQQEALQQEVLELMVKVAVAAQEDLILHVVIILEAQVEPEW